MTKSNLNPLDPIITQMYKDIRKSLHRRHQKLMSDFIRLVNQRLKLDPSRKGRQQLFKLLNEERQKILKERPRARH